MPIIYKRNIRKENRIEKRRQEKRHKKFSSKIGNCQARPKGEINLPISRIYEHAIKFLLLLNIIMRKFFMLLSIHHIIITIYYLLLYIQPYPHDINTVEYLRVPIFVPVLYVLIVQVRLDPYYLAIKRKTQCVTVQCTFADLFFPPIVG